MSNEEGLVIGKITFKAGLSPQSSGLELESLGNIVLFVGPNNSGKTRTLVELYSLLDPVRKGRHGVRGHLVLDETDIECTY